ncbi:MAG TPA: hypothetical protein VMW50_10030 [Dehalococcoidia bacterium]|nr:hypothetical protein [Dehalococcoidia bacterium]
MEKIKEILEKEFRDIPVNVLNKEEDKVWMRENEIDFEESDMDYDYLIVMDGDESMYLGGAFEITLENGEFRAVWLPYPEDPFKSIEEFVAHVKN